MTPLPPPPHAAATLRDAVARLEIPEDIADAVSALGDGPLTDDGLAAHIRPRFSRVLERDEIYLANHSLGRPLDRTNDDVREAMDLWYADMDGAWEAWLKEIELYRARWAAMIGASRPDCVVPKTNAGQGLRAILNALPVDRPRVVATRGEFDSMDVILKTYQHRSRAEVRWVEPDAEGLFHADDVIGAITDETDLVLVSQVYFVTGQLLEGLERIIEAAHDRGALVVVDTYHSAGVMPVDMAALDADFAVGGAYKYVRGGAGACWLMIHPRHLDAEPRALVTLDTGWFAKENVFAYERHDPPRFGAGGDAWLESTPPILTAYQARSGLCLTLALGLDRLRAHNLCQQSRLNNYLTEAGVPTRTLDPRGAYLLIPTNDAQALCAALKHAGVNTDARGPYVRLCPDILTTDDELRDAAMRIAKVMN